MISTRNDLEVHSGLHDIKMEVNIIGKQICDPNNVQWKSGANTYMYSPGEEADVVWFMSIIVSSVTCG